MAEWIEDREVLILVKSLCDVLVESGFRPTVLVFSLLISTSDDVLVPTVLLILVLS